jgi:F0F1-type ATP synthase delta subunit
MSKLTKDQWNEIIAKVKAGEKVVDLANIYGVSAKTIYNKTGKIGETDNSLLEINRLKREVKQLREVLGYVTTELSKEKKLI